MSYLPATSEYGLIVRKRSMIERGIDLSELSAAVFDIDVLGENNDLISLGPMFGQEALDEIKLRLSQLGLQYFDDYFDFNFTTPDWIDFGVSLLKVTKD